MLTCLKPYTSLVGGVRDVELHIKCAYSEIGGAMCTLLGFFLLTHSESGNF